MRKLATIRKIDRLSTIEGADKIELAHTGGWQCVVGKGQFHPGELAIFYEIDSALPTDDPRYVFLHDRCKRTWKNNSGETLCEVVRIKMKSNKYTDRNRNKFVLHSENGLSRSEMKYLIRPNPFNESFTIWAPFEPKINEPFFCAKIEVNGSSRDRDYRFGIIPIINRIEIISDGEVKKYRVESLLTYSAGDTLCDGYEKYDDFHQIGKSRIVPDENFVCNCGVCNRDLIKEFPWKEHPEFYIIAETLFSLENKIEILMKDLDFYDIQKYIHDNLVQRKKKIDEIISLNPDKFKQKD